MDKPKKRIEFDIIPGRTEPEQRFDMFISNTDGYTREGAMTLEAKRHQLEIKLLAIKVEFSQEEVTRLNMRQADMILRFINHMSGIAEQLADREFAYQAMRDSYDRQLPVLERQLSALNAVFHDASVRISGESIRVKPEVRQIIDVTPQPKKGLLRRIHEAIFGTGG